MGSGGQGRCAEIVPKVVGLFKMTHTQTTDIGDKNGGERFTTEQAYPLLRYGDSSRSGGLPSRADLGDLPLACLCAKW